MTMRARVLWCQTNFLNLLLLKTTLHRLVLWTLISTYCPLTVSNASAVTSTISSNLVSYSPGKTLSLSYSIQAESSAGTASDIYIAGILPDGSILLLGSNMAFTTALSPMLEDVSLSNLNAPGFLSAALPDGLPSGIYQFYVVVVRAGTDPAFTANWLTSASTSFSYAATGSGVDSFLYFKRGGPAIPQAATITFPNNSGTGTLNIDGKSIPGIFYTAGVAGQGCLGGGTGNTLTRCFSPSELPNTIFLCGPDPATGTGEVLLYVMFYDPDSKRAANTASNYLSALQSETRYLGGNVYRDCNGSFQNSWIRDYPSTNYYRWPDIVTTYSGSYVADLLNGAAIYSTPTAGNKYYEFVIIRSTGGTLEVWH